MAIRASYAKGWGPAKVQDARLKGWEPLECAAPNGSTAEVISVEQKTVGEPHALEPILYVVARVRTPEGETWVVDYNLRRPTKAPVWDMPELAAYLDLVAGPQGVAGLKEELEPLAFDAERIVRAKDGPRLTPLQFLQALDAVDLWRGLGLEGDDDGEVASTKRALRLAIDWAFLAGRRIAEAEFPSQLQRTKAVRAARRRSSEAEAWWPDGAKWAQQIVESWPSERRLSIAALANRMWETWSTGPSGRPVEVSPRYLETVILPRWKAAGLLSLPAHAVKPKAAPHG